ncbi:lysine--tRNA ligase [Kitasatospora sp. NPDC096147]|uniref:lysine--tRNA ligase n=1 Tax=Kitasatospora sp. NPDC096147 TaxID=3364093 RepID=UPI0038282DFA
MSSAEQSDWVTASADQVVAEGKRRAPGAPLVCASGISPSGPVHLGNLRELMVPHLVADELRRRGLDCRHVLSWDDFDRLRKVPAGMPESFAEHIGRPLSEVPDPCGGAHANWAEHFKAPFRAELAALGVEVTEVSQTEMYRSGAYTGQILHAMRERGAIDAILGRYRTVRTPAPEGESPEPDTDETPAAGEYYPYKPYCGACGRDSTTVTAYEDETAEVSYTCHCGHRDTDVIGRTGSGKLVWKVDWPMRWAHEGVTFEGGGVDHSSPGSSFTVGSQVVGEIFGGRPPVYLGFSFVGIRGMAKMSGSAGGAPTLGDALRLLEAPLIRWLYARRRPNQSFTISFDQEISRIYDEWDAAGRRLADGAGDPLERATRTRALGTVTATLPLTARPVPFKLLASVVDITTGDEAQILRILGDLTEGEALGSLDPVRPRLDRAQTWVAEQVPAEERTRVRTDPDHDLLAGLTDGQREALDLLSKGLDDHWSLDGLTTLVYGVPKQQAGLPLDTAPTPELKAAQRTLFALLYRLLTGAETGPRLPTLLLALGPDRIRTLLGG